MLRKIMALTIVAVMVMAMCIIPTSAESLSDNLIFNADYRTGSMEDQTGKYAIDAAGSDDAIYKEVGGVKAAVFGGSDGSASLIYVNGPTMLGYDLSKGLTVEAYVNLDADNVNTGNIFCLGINAVLLTDYNDSSDHACGFRCTDNNDPEWTVNPSLSMCNAYKQESLTRGEWHHMVGVCNGTTNVFYLDGVKVAENTRLTKEFHPQTLNEDLAKSIIIGSGGGAWTDALINGAIAFARLYTTEVTADEVTLLYNDAKSGAAPSGGSNPTQAPSGDTTPTAAPTEAPAATATPAPTQAPDATNAKTFDVGIVALAAVSLSSLVVVRRKKG